MQPTNMFSGINLDKTAFSVISLAEQDRDEKDYWKSKSPHERLIAVEQTRQVLYGYDSTSARLQRVLEIARLGDA